MNERNACLSTGAMSSAAHVLSGEIGTGSQHHFHMETQVRPTRTPKMEISKQAEMITFYYYYYY